MIVNDTYADELTDPKDQMRHRQRRVNETLASLCHIYQASTFLAQP